MLIGDSTTTGSGWLDSPLGLQGEEHEKRLGSYDISGPVVIGAKKDGSQLAYPCVETSCEPIGANEV